MLKKSTGIFALMVFMVAFTSWAATVWQVQTKLINVGGTINVRGIDKSTVGVTVMNNYTTSTGIISVVVTPSSGYKIAKVTKSGVEQTIGDPTKAFTANFLKSGGTNQSLVATFSQTQMLVTSTPTSGGNILPAQLAVGSGGSATFTVTPINASTFVSTITPN